jgi:hypothetical protein
MLVAWLTPVSSTCLAAPKDQLDMACVEQVAGKLPGPVKPASIRQWPIKARKLGTKRLLFQRGDVFLVVDHSLLHEGLQRFRKDHDDRRFPEAENLMRRFLTLMEDADEAMVNESALNRWERALLDNRLAAVLEDGRFQIRTSPKPQGRKDDSTSTTIIRLDWSYFCGELCSGKGRTFVTQSCQELVSVTDLQS